MIPRTILVIASFFNRQSMKDTRLSTELALSLMNHSICRRAALMHMLLTGYSLFDSIQLRKKAVNVKLTYQQAEELADLMEQVTGIKTPPSALLHDENEIADTLLKDYAELNEMIDSQLDETMRPIVDAYYHHLYYTRRLNGPQTTLLLIGLSAFLNYAQGKIDKQELKNGFISVDLRNMKTEAIDTRHARQMLITLENDFNEICIKYANRIRKKNGEGPCGCFSINITT